MSLRNRKIAGNLSRRQTWLRPSFTQQAAKLRHTYALTNERELSSRQDTLKGDHKSSETHLPYFSAIKDFWSHYSHIFLMCLIRDFAKLKVFDELPNDHDHEFISIEDICTKLQLNPDNTFRGLRFLSLFGYTMQSPENDTIFETPKKLFRNSVKSQVFRSDSEFNEIASVYNCMLHKDWMSCLLDYTTTLKIDENGESINAWDNFHKISIFEHAQRPENIEFFDEYRRSLTAHDTDYTYYLPKVYDFSGGLDLDGSGSDDDLVIADIGGGFGDILVSLLKHFESETKFKGFSIKTMLFETDYVIDKAKDRLYENKFEHLDKIEFVKGDFFKKIDCEADIYILKYIYIT